MVIHALKLYRFHEVARRKLIRFEELETWQSRRWLLRIIESSSKPDHYLGRARAFFWRALISISSDTYLEKEAEVSFDRFSSSIFLFSFRTNFSVLKKESQLSHDHRRLNGIRENETHLHTSSIPRREYHASIGDRWLVRFRYPAYPYLQA